MSNGKKNDQYAILDKILADSQEGRGEVVWVQDPRHPQGGYYVQVSSQAGGGVGNGNADEIERYLRS